MSQMQCSTYRQHEVVTCMFCPDRSYAVLTVPAHIQRVKRVVFKISSRDQGYCSSPESGSWSWISLRVITPSGHNRVIPPMIFQDHHQAPAAVWNALGDPKYQEHVKVWDANSEDAYIKNLLHSIRPGDSMHVLPNARFGGWRTYIREVTIEVFGSDPVIPPSLHSHPSECVENPGSCIDLYKPLDPAKQETRLVRLRSGPPDSEIICQLEYISLKDNEHTAYQALSYCWGDPTDQRVIKMAAPGHDSPRLRFSVTRNLHEALMHLRNEDGDEQVFWIDAICINQTDFVERAQQVGIIREIYSEAAGVAVWLGPCSPNMQKGIDELKRIEAALQQAITTGEKMCNIQGVHDLNNTGWSYVAESPLFTFEYFRRTWVLQEVFNAREVLVYCGKNAISWASVLRINYCITQSVDWVRPLPRITMPALFSGLFEIMMPHQPGQSLTYKRKPKSLSILDTFISGLDLDASDPRDKIFALLSFGEDTQDVANLPADIAPNYDKTVGCVYSDFTRWWIVKHRSLRILSAVHASKGRTWQHLTSLTSFPVPNRTSWSLWHDGVKNASIASLALYSHSPQFEASAGTKPDIELLGTARDPDVLRLRGHRLGSIQGISVFPYYDKYAGKKNKLPEDIYRAYELLLDPVNEFGSWVTGAQREVFRNEPNPTRSNNISQHFSVHSSFSRRTRGIECHHPCYLETSNGDRGLCPPGAQVNDIVLVLHGGRVPFVLRPVEQHDIGPERVKPKYYLIGECYVIGYMQGQVLSKNDDGTERFPVEDFDLI